MEIDNNSIPSLVHKVHESNGKNSEGEPKEDTKKDPPVEIPEYLNSHVFYAFFSPEKKKWFLLFDHRQKQIRSQLGNGRYGAYIERWKVGEDVYKFYRHAIPYGEYFKLMHNNDTPYFTLLNITRNNKLVADAFHFGPKDSMKVKLCIKNGKKGDFFDVEGIGTAAVMAEFHKRMGLGKLTAEGNVVRIQENYPCWNFYKLANKELIQESFLRTVDESVLQSWQEKYRSESKETTEIPGAEKPTDDMDQS